MIKRVARPGATILDIAAAQGNFSLALADLGYRVVWNDLREELIEYVRQKDEGDRLEYRPGNVFDLALDSLVDVALIGEVIEHVAHPDRFLKRVAELVAPGGSVVMTTPNGEYFRNKLPKFSTCIDPERFEAIQFKPNADGHIFLLHADELEGLAASAGLLLEETRLFTNPLSNGNIKLESLLRFLPESLVDGAERFTGQMPYFVRRKLSTAMAILFRRPYSGRGAE